MVLESVEQLLPIKGRGFNEALRKLGAIFDVGCEGPTRSLAPTAKQETMSLEGVLYTCICLGGSIKAEAGTKPSAHTLKGALRGDAMILMLLAFIDGAVSGPFAHQEKGSFNHDINSYNFKRGAGGSLFIAVATQALENRVVYSFLDEALSLYEQGGDREALQHRLGVLLARFQPKSKLQLAQEEVDSTKVILTGTISNLMERGAQLEELETSAHNMEAEASHLEHQSHEVVRCAKWKRFKCRILIACCCLIAIIIAVVVAVVVTQKA